VIVLPPSTSVYKRRGTLDRIAVFVLITWI